MIKRSSYEIFSLKCIILFYTFAYSSFNISNFQFIFISGWPQSGTSFIQQIFTLNNLFSTQVNGCFERLGSKCLNINNEGQWLLLRNNTWDAIFRPGKMCPVSSHDIYHSQVFLDEHFDTLIQQWRIYWDVSKFYLVEKSPQSMLKIQLFEYLFKRAYKVKFIVVLKHPVTLNIALPKGTSWLKHKVDYKNGALPREIANPMENIVANFEYFIHFMTKNDSKKNFDCNYGWLSSIERLLTMKTETIDLSIVNYEDFSRPVETCTEILNYATNRNRSRTQEVPGNKIDHDNYLFQKNKIFCKHIFRIKKVKQNLKPQRNLRQKALHSSRSLRLKFSESKKGVYDYRKLDFDYSIIENSIYSRLRDFNIARSKLELYLKQSSSNSRVYKILIDLKTLESSLQKFGYSLKFNSNVKFLNKARSEEEPNKIFTFSNLGKVTASDLNFENFRLFHPTI